MPIKGGWIGNNTYIKVLQGRDGGHNGKNGKDGLMGWRGEKREQRKRGPPGQPRGGVVYTHWEKDSCPNITTGAKVIKEELLVYTIYHANFGGKAN